MTQTPCTFFITSESFGNVKVYWWWQSFTISVSNTLHGRAILLAPGGPHSGLNSEKKVCLMYYLSIRATKNLKVFGAITRRTHTNYLILDFFPFCSATPGKSHVIDAWFLQLFTQIMQLHSTQKKTSSKKFPICGRSHQLLFYACISNAKIKKLCSDIVFEVVIYHVLQYKSNVYVHCT